MRSFILVPLILVLCNCGGGGDASTGTTVTTETKTIYFPSGRVAETGQIQAGTDIRVGEWRSYFDLDGSPQQFVGIYTNGTLDASKPWREWNADGSIRDDASDR